MGFWIDKNGNYFTKTSYNCLGITFIILLCQVFLVKKTI